MKLGVCAFVTDRGPGICGLARQVEDAGLESLFVCQNTHVPLSGASLLQEDFHSADHRLADPFVALGAAAAVTTGIRLGTAVCVAPIYDPIVLAMQVSTLDQVSSGRFMFGIGVGHDDTVANHGVPAGLRYQVLREKVQAMKALWAGGNAEFHGEFVDFDPVLPGLRPRQEPHPPILIGSQGARGIANTVEYGDGWMPIVYRGLDLGAQVQELERRCQAAGRPPAPVTAALLDIDEPLLHECAELGVERCVTAVRAEDDDDLPAFLERYTPLAGRFGD